jgi:hypothetical protein
MAFRVAVTFVAGKVRRSVDELLELLRAETRRGWFVTTVCVLKYVLVYGIDLVDCFVAMDRTS